MASPEAQHVAHLAEPAGTEPAALQLGDEVSISR